MVHLFIKTDPNGTGFRDNYPNQYNLYCGLGLSAWLHVLRSDNCDSLIKSSRLSKIRVLLIYRNEYYIENVASGPTQDKPYAGSKKSKHGKILGILQLG